MIELMFLKEFMLIRQTNQKSEIFVVILNRGFKFQSNVCNGYHHSLMMSMNLSYIAILNIQSAHYRRIISGISKIEAINITQTINLTEKSRVF